MILEHIGRSTPELEKLRIQQSTRCCFYDSSLSIVQRHVPLSFWSCWPGQLCPHVRSEYTAFVAQVNMFKKNCPHGVFTALGTMWNQFELLENCEISYFIFHISMAVHCPYMSNVHAKALFCIFADEEEVWKNSCPSYWQAVTVGSYISDRKHQRRVLAIYILNTSAQVAKLYIRMRYIENCRSDLTQKRLHQCNV